MEIYQVFFKVIKYCETVYERSGKNMFWPIKNSGEVLSKLKDIGYHLRFFYLVHNITP